MIEGIGVGIGGAPANPSLSAHCSRPSTLLHVVLRGEERDIVVAGMRAIAEDVHHETRVVTAADESVSVQIPFLVIATARPAHTQLSVVLDSVRSAPRIRSPGRAPRFGPP